LYFDKYLSLSIKSLPPISPLFKYIKDKMNPSQGFLEMANEKVFIFKFAYGLMSFF
jgi:hypothetical protein